MHIFTRLKKHSAIRLLPVLCALVSISPEVLGQAEPEAPPVPFVLRNGWQLSGYFGVSYNVFHGGYAADCPCEFLANATSGSYPYGLSLNVPINEELSLYLRAGMQTTSTLFTVGRVDSLRSQPVVGDLADELTVEYSLFSVDILLRLIGKLDGERIFVGPSFGFVRKKSAEITETELQTGYQYTIENGDIEGARTLRTSIVIGAEYAFIPTRNLFIIPSVQVDYSPQKITDLQPLRPVFYKFVLNVAYQLF